MAFKDLNVEGLYQALEKELGADIAIVIRDENLSGEDFLGLTEDEVASIFSKLGQRKKVLQLITAITALTAEVNIYLCSDVCCQRVHGLLCHCMLIQQFYQIHCQFC